METPLEEQEREKRAEMVLAELSGDDRAAQLRLEWLRILDEMYYE